MSTTPTVDVELVDHRRVMALVTFAHGERDVDRLVGALRDLVDERGKPGQGTRVQMPSRSELRTEQAMRPRDAFFGPSEFVEIKQAAGRVSAELVTPYPPGIPAVAPGEVYNEATIAYLREIAALGGFVEGAVDQQLEHLASSGHEPPMLQLSCSASPMMMPSGPRRKQSR